MDLITAIPALPPRPRESNKGSFGRVVVVGGSRGMAGAAILCASAALRAGAGLVKAAVPQGILATVASGNPCAMTWPLPEDDAGRIAAEDLADQVRDGDVLAVGPGLGQSEGLRRLVPWVLTQVRQPVVLDADGLNALAHDLGSLAQAPGPRVLTPHPGEFARLLGSDPRSVQASRRELAFNFARTHEVVLLLKGAGTVVTDGARLYENTTGNPGMATGGTGDVLTGVIAALLAQHFGAFEAAVLGAYVHGLAGDLARDRVGEISLIATDVLEALPQAFQQLSR